MQSFEPGLIERQPITQNLLRTIRLIGEYKGKQDLFKEQSPQVLETLQQAAIIQSTESSNRIEGITAPLERIKELVAEFTLKSYRWAAGMFRARSGCALAEEIGTILIK